MNKNSIIYSVLLCFFLTFPLFPQDVINAGKEAEIGTPAAQKEKGESVVNEEEFSSYTNREVTFKNFIGKILKQDSVANIISIGKNLALDLEKDGREGGSKSRYYIKAFPPSEQHLGGDILVLGKNAKVGHIKNVRRILAGYLETRYKYNETRATAVAWFIIVYNAVKRGESAYFENRFTKEMNEFIPNGKEGISQDYTEWAGATYLVVPISLRGAISAAEVGREATAKAGEEGKNAEMREEFLKERKDQLNTDKKEFAKEVENVNKAEAELVQKEKELVVEKETAIKAGDTAKVAATDEKLAQVETNKIELAEKKEKLEDKATAIADEQAAIESEGEKIKDDTFMKEAKVQAVKEAATKEEMAQDNVSMGLIFFLKTTGSIGAHLVQELLAINPKDNTFRKVNVKGISGKFLDFWESDPLLITFDDPQNLNCYLTRINRNDFTVAAKSKEGVYAGSKIWVKNGSIFVVGFENKKSFLYKFDKDMKLLAKSVEQVFPDTDLTIYEGKIYSTIMDGAKNAAVAVFNETDLVQVAIIK